MLPSPLPADVQLLRNSRQCTSRAAQTGSQRRVRTHTDSDSGSRCLPMSLSLCSPFVRVPLSASHLFPRRRFCCCLSSVCPLVQRAQEVGDEAPRRRRRRLREARRVAAVSRMRMCTKRDVCCASARMFSNLVLMPVRLCANCVHVRSQNLPRRRPSADAGCSAQDSGDEEAQTGRLERSYSELFSWAVELSHLEPRSLVRKQTQRHKFRSIFSSKRLVDLLLLANCMISSQQHAAMITPVMVTVLCVRLRHDHCCCTR